MAQVKTDLDFEENDLTPMIDIIFLLIAFFMIVAHLIDQTTIKIEPPVADQSVIPKHPKRVTVSIMQQFDGSRYYFAGIEMPPQEMAPLMRDSVNANPSIKLYIRADKNVPHRAVREVMAVAKENQLNRVTFAAFEEE